MILNINGLGIVKNIRIDLNKQFIVFCGCNNTGKTYASYILNAFLRGSADMEFSRISDIITQISEKKLYEVKREHVEEWLNARCQWVTENLSNIFGLSDDSTKSLFPDFKINAEYSDEDFDDLLKKEITSERPLSGFTITKGVVSLNQASDRLNFLKEFVFLQRLFINQIFRTILFGPNVRMMTVERNSIYTFKTELSLSRNELINQLQQNAQGEQDIINLIETKTRRYPLAVSNSLRIANDLSTIQKFPSQFSDIAERIECDLLFGEVNINGNGDVEFHDRGMTKNSRLPFHISSSIVKTMASLVIYLRHLAKEGDTLIIDEPEMNFHPDVQVILARVFAILSNRGIRIVISTHSDYVIREINNLIMAKKIKDKGDEEIIKELGYSEDMLLDYNNVGVHYFEKKSSKTVKVDNLKIDEYGFAVTSIDETINRQNDAADKLNARMYD